MNWYYESAGQQQGPVADAELDRLLADGKITPDTLVWREGLPGWAPLRTARPNPPGLAGAGAAAMPPPPPVPPASAPGADAPPPGYIRCSLTGKYFPPSEIIYIEGRPYSAEAKPQVMQSLQAGAALPGNALDRTGPPWEQRDQLGIVKALIETVKAVLTQPSQTFASMKREGGLGSPLLFWWLTSGVGLAISQFYNMFIQGATFGMLSSLGAGRGTPVPSAMFGTAVQAVMIVVMPAIAFVMMFVYAGLVHLAMKLLKAGNQPFETTLRTLCYSQGSGGILGIIPICGGTVGGIWAIVCLCMGLGKTHDTSTEKGVGGALLPMAFCCVLYIGIAVVVFGGMAAIGAAASHH